MPLPLQTLLVALSDLKQDIVRDKCNQMANHEATSEATIETVVSITLKSLSVCHSEKAEAIALGYANNADKNLEAEIQAIVGPTSDSSEWVPKLTDALRKEGLLASQKVLKDHEKEPIVREPKQFASCDRALQAVEDSKTTRKRLEQLAQGPLSSLFEHPVKIESNKKGLEDVMRGPLQIQPMKIEDNNKRYDEVKALLRRTERLRRSILQIQHTLIDQAIHQAEATIDMALCKLSVGPFHYMLPDDMRIADLKIQSEIKYVIQTITTDPSSLDQVLRNIKSSCVSIEKESLAESTAHWIIMMAKWRLQLTEAYKQR
jgi:hypothetical protein